MDFSRLNRERVLVGGIASILLILSLLFLPWYSYDLASVEKTSNPDNWICGVDETSCTGFETFPILRWLLLLAALAPAILAWILIRGHKLSWAPGELTMVAGFAAFVLIAYNGIIDKPGNGDRRDRPRPLDRLLDRAAGRGRDRLHRLHALDGVRRPAEAQGARHRLSPEHGLSVISHDLRSGSKPDRNLALELVRVTEAAALAAARWVGRGEKEAADQAAVDAMRLLLDTVPMDGVVVIGEGEKDEAPMLYNGEQIGDGSPPEVDIAVDPLEGTRLTARGQPAALSVIALAERGHDVRPRALRLHGEDRRRARGSPTCSASTSRSERWCGEVAERRRVDVGDVTVIMLDRERHAEAVEQVREVGGADPLHHRRRRLGGAARGHRGHRDRPAVGDRRHARGRALGGGDQVPRRSAPRSPLAARRRRARRRRSTPATTSTRCSTSTGLVGGADVFFAATGVTDGRPARRASATSPTVTRRTESLVMRSRSGTVRKVEARHDRPKLREVTGGRYG